MDRSTYVQLGLGGLSRAGAGLDGQVLDAIFEPSHEPVKFTPNDLPSRGRSPQTRTQDTADR